MAKSTKKSKKGVSRRGFIGAAAGAAAGAGAIVTGVPTSEAQVPGASNEVVRQVAARVPAPTATQVQRDAGETRPPATVRAATAPGSDLQVQVLRDLGIEFVSSNPGSSFEGLQESIINYGNPPNRMPEFITALHEMSAVDMAHGYGKAEGKPMVALLHGTIGIQNAAMAIYQAYHDQTPILLIAGRDDGFIQNHTADDMAGICRSFTKWDAQPTTMEASLTALQEAYNQTMTPPCAPALVVLDMEFQKAEVPGMTAPEPRPLQITGIDQGQAREIAVGLVGADNPRIEVGRLRTPEGVRRAVELAELVGASTSTAATQGPMSFPQRHPLCGPGAETDYDFTLGLESPGAQASITGPHIRTLEDERDVTDIGYGGNRPGGGNREGRSGPPAGANDITADAEASLPAIIEEVRQVLTADNRRTIEQRKAGHAEANQRARIADLRAAVESKRAGWDASPVSTARLYSELWPHIMNEDWCLASPTGFSGGHNRQLWDHNKPYSHLGGQGAGGMGYGLGASVGAALAARERGRIVVNIQTDGDLNYSPGALWTAAHHRLPMLTVMHNNRAWHQETMFVEYVCGVRGRSGRGHIGTTLRDPFIDYASMAKGYGMAGEGPISDPTKLAAAFRRGVESVKMGEPYLIDVLTQPR